MEIVLITLGIVGFGAIVIAAYVFTVAARNYVSTEDQHFRDLRNSAAGEDFVARAPIDRRRNPTQPQFPMIVNSVVIPRDRRTSPERRAAA
jgi:hypothetical protein